MKRGLLGSHLSLGKPQGRDLEGEGNVTRAGRGRGRELCLEKQGIRLAPALQAARGRIPGGEPCHSESRLPPGKEKRPFRILRCLVGEQGRGPLASCPAIWRAGRRAPGAGPGSLGGHGAPTSPAAPSLPGGGCGAVALRGDCQAAAGPGPRTPPSIPGASAAMTHISAPTACLLPWP